VGNPWIEAMADQIVLKSNLLAPRTHKLLCEPAKLIVAKHGFLVILSLTLFDLFWGGTKSDKIRLAQTQLTFAILLNPIPKLFG